MRSTRTALLNTRAEQYCTLEDLSITAYSGDFQIQEHVILGTALLHGFARWIISQLSYIVRVPLSLE